MPLPRSSLARSPWRIRSARKEARYSSSRLSCDLINKVRSLRVRKENQPTNKQTNQPVSFRRSLMNINEKSQLPDYAFIFCKAPDPGLSGLVGEQRVIKLKPNVARGDRLLTRKSWALGDRLCRYATHTQPSLPPKLPI